MGKVNSVKKMNKVQMELGGKLRTMQFDMNAFAELENRYGTIDDAFTALEKGRISDIKVILWSALIHEEAIIDEVTGEPTGYNITPYQVGSWIKTPAMMGEATQKLTIAMGVDLTEPEKLPEEVRAMLEENGIKLAPEPAKN